MKGIVVSSLLAGFIAGFVWMAIFVLTGGTSKGMIVGVGVVFLVATTVVAGIINTLIRRSKSGAGARPSTSAR